MGRHRRAPDRTRAPSGGMGFVRARFATVA